MKRKVLMLIHVHHEWKMESRKKVKSFRLELYRKKYTTVSNDCIKSKFYASYNSMESYVGKEDKKTTD